MSATPPGGGWPTAGPPPGPPGTPWGAPPGGGGYGPPPGYYGGGFPQGPPPPAPSASSRAIGALICAILSWVMCGCFTSIPAAFMGWAEMKDIEAGNASPAGKTLAQIAFWVSIANIALYSVILVIYLIMAVFMGVSMATHGPP